MPVKELQRLGPAVLGGVLPRIYPEVLRTAYDHQDAGRPAYIVTAASHEMAELMAHVLVFDGGIGTRSEIKNGVYTGQPGGPFTYRSGKAEAIRQVAAENGIDLSESYAYSDSESDMPMLERGGVPRGGEPRSRAREDRPGERLADHALRQARPPRCASPRRWPRWGRWAARWAWAAATWPAAGARAGPALRFR